MRAAQSYTRRRERRARLVLAALFCFLVTRVFVRGLAADLGPPPRARGLVSVRLDPRSASAAELSLLPGLGRESARRLVAFARGRARPLRASEVLAIPGIGPATLARIRAQLVLARAGRLDGRAEALGSEPMSGGDAK